MAEWRPAPPVSPTPAESTPTQDPSLTATWAPGGGLPQGELATLASRSLAADLDTLGGSWSEGGSGLSSLTQLAPGHMLAERYRLIRKIGEGGMGEVWEAEHTIIRRRLAIKVLSRVDDARGERGQRLLREARTTAALLHPNIVEITDFGQTAAGIPFVVMELLHGRTFKQVLADEGPLHPDRLVPLLVQICEALAVAHEAGIVHRDLKPDNVFVVRTADGEQCKMIDFGIAKMTTLDDAARTITRTGLIYGTPAFMSPEQARGEQVDARSDVYALGCAAYQLLAGRLPFEGKNPTQMLYRQLFEEAPPLRALAPSVSEGLEAVVRRCMRKRPENRFDSAHAVADALRDLGSGRIVHVPEEELRPPPMPGESAGGPRPTSESHPTAESAPMSMAGGSPRGPRTAVILVGAALAVVGAGGAAFFAVRAARQADASEATPSANEATPSASEAATAANGGERIGAQTADEAPGGPEPVEPVDLAAPSGSTSAGREAAASVEGAEPVEEAEALAPAPEVGESPEPAHTKKKSRKSKQDAGSTPSKPEPPVDDELDDKPAHPSVGG